MIFGGTFAFAYAFFMRIGSYAQYAKDRVPVFDYCLTTTLCKTEKARFPSVFNGFRNVRRILTLSPEIRTMIESTAFYQDAPENSDSVGRTFESCRAYQS